MWSFGEGCVLVGPSPTHAIQSWAYYHTVSSWVQQLSRVFWKTFLATRLPSCGLHIPSPPSSILFPGCVILVYMSPQDQHSMVTPSGHTIQLCSVSPANFLNSWDHRCPLRIDESYGYSPEKFMDKFPPLFERIQIEFSEVYPWNFGAPVDTIWRNSLFPPVVANIFTRSPWEAKTERSWVQRCPGRYTKTLSQKIESTALEMRIRTLTAFQHAHSGSQPLVTSSRASSAYF